MAQHDYNIANASFPTVRTDINNVLSAINSSNSGSSRPSSAVAGTIWLDTSGAATAQLLKLYDGADDILLGTVNFTANTIDWADSASEVSLNGTETLTNKTLTSALITTNLSPTSADGAALGSATKEFSDLFLADSGTIQFGNDQDTTLTHVADTGLQLNSTRKIMFNDASQFIHGADGFTLDIAAASKIELTSALVSVVGNLTSTGVASFAKAANVAQGALTSSSNAVAWDSSAKPNAVHITTENTTFSAPSNPVEGAFIALEINYNGSHTIAFNTVFEFAASTAPTFTSSADGKTDILVFRYNGAVWQEVGRTLNLSES